MTTSLLEAARAWLAEDPDAETRAELSELIDAAATDGDAAADLADRFSGMLQFGTAGLRGALGAGPNRMNRVVVIRAAAGLAAYLKETGARGPVVIGYDARTNSDVFARDTAEVMTGAGLEALLLPGPLPTPVLAFAIRDQGASAGVMVTASHNPPRDNGYKVYLGDGSQIVPPADAEIAARIDAVGALADVPRGAGGRVLGDDLVDRYLTRVAALVGAGGPREVSVVHTALHGVGSDIMLRALRLAGFPEATSVAEQAEPDPAFPTVAFPNPEEPGAMDLALARAAEVGADLVVASDPDADRCAVAVPAPDGWRMLRGDEVGALLADHLLRTGVHGAYACSIVSSSLLATLAAAYEQPFVETLTGFKWIGRVDGLAFGYEEALGYCVDPGVVRDKDGISAGIRIVELAALLKAEGRSLLDRLDEIAVRHGLHATDQLSVRVTDLADIARAMERLRTTPPTALGGARVTSADDLREGTATLPPTDGLRYRLDDGARVIVRPSGTEPKLKCYLEVVVDAAADLGAARAEAAGRLERLKTDVRAALGL
ncbi:phospho-sugar mutase [Nocardioides sp. BP30]|uniref:phospho-sugar mutase n=1 Tax=Nocardioides sp. BP30 TaxID=3036374 RepID=UPI0024692964|nr:phospho-sugar mutase [Nocardioides sp. BP30]WGL51700.1 phospho-sugar mutase [Nocardioides sp. BP30]